MEQPSLLHMLEMIGDYAFGLEETERVWNDMRKYPHCFELAAARGQLDTLDMQGVTVTHLPWRSHILCIFQMEG